MKVLRICIFTFASALIPSVCLPAAARQTQNNPSAQQSPPGRPAKPSPPGSPRQKRPGGPPMRPAPPRPAPPHAVRPRPPYNFRPGDRDRMRRYYARNFGYINRSRRPHFVIGGFIPLGYRTYFRPVPPHLLGYLPPPPPGYVIGYLQGYCVVYDPTTFAIVSFVDLLN